MINHVKEVIVHHEVDVVSNPGIPGSCQEATELAHRQRTVVRRKYISWHAASAALAEVIEYLEELIDLTKLLVGASEFRSGLLTRPSYAGFIEMIGKEVDGSVGSSLGDQKLKDGDEGIEMGSGVERHRTATAASGQDGEGVPVCLRRIHSRKIQAGIERQRTNLGSGR